MTRDHDGGFVSDDERCRQYATDAVTVLRRLLNALDPVTRNRVAVRCSKGCQHCFECAELACCDNLIIAEAQRILVSIEAGAHAPRRPEVVCLCGSTRFRDEFVAENRRLTLEGRIVLTVGLFGHHEPSFAWDDSTKAMLDDLHLRKIDMADRVHVIDVGGYVGPSTRREIEYAESKGLPVTYLSRAGEHGEDE